MSATATTLGLLQALEDDLRRLSAEARQTESIAGWATGLLRTAGGGGGGGGGGRYGLAELKETSERSLLKVRSLVDEDQETILDELANSEEIMRTAVTACNNRGARVVAVGIGFLQKLVAHGAVTRESMPSILQCMQHCSESNNEKVQLKALQLLLTMLQSALRPENPENVFIFMQVSIRLLTGSKCTDSVQKTAESALRQVTGLVMNRAAEVENVPVPPATSAVKRHHSNHQEDSGSMPPEYVTQWRGADEASPRPPAGTVADVVQGHENPNLDSEAQELHACVRSAYYVFRSLSSVLESPSASRPSSSRSHEWTWAVDGVSALSVPPNMALDLLENTMDTHRRLLIRVPVLMATFRTVVVPSLHRALEVDAGDVSAGDDGANSGSTHKANGQQTQNDTSSASCTEREARRRLLYRLVGCVARGFVTTLQPEIVEGFMSALIRDLESDLPAKQKLDILRVLKSICENAPLLEECYARFDWHLERQSVVTKIVDAIVRFIDGGLSNTNSYSVEMGPSADGQGDRRASAGHTGEADPQNHPQVSLSSSKSGGGNQSGQQTSGTHAHTSHATVDGEGMMLIANIFGSSGAASGVDGLNTEHFGGSATRSSISLAGAVAVAIDCLACIVQSIEAMADAESVYDQERSSAGGGGQHDGDGDRQSRISVGDIARDMICRLWKTILSSLQLLLSRFTSEAIVLRVLRSYQSFTRAAGHLKVASCRDAFISSLCHFALTRPDTHNPVRATDAKAVAAETANGSPAPSLTSSTGQRRLERSLSDYSSSKSRIGRIADESLAGGTASGVGTSVHSLDHKILTHKNIQSLRTLFDIAHELSETLGSSWSLVVSTLDALDHTLDHPIASGQELARKGSGNAAGGGALHPEVEILSQAVLQLFQSTAKMDKEALMHLYMALRSVSENSLSTMDMVKSKASKLFALNHMADIVEYNAHRGNVLWPALVEHILDILTRDSTSAETRDAAIAALGRVMSTAINHKPGCLAKQGAVNGDGHTTDTLDGPVLELVALSPLPELYGSPVYPADVRAASLRCLLSILQKSGIAERLDDGWGTLLRLLTEVANSPDLEVLALGFQSVLLIMNDFLAMVPFEMLKDSIFCLSAYIHQKADLNTSLSALNLLWNAVDYLGGIINDGHDEEDDDGAGDEDSEDATQPSKPHVAVPTPEQVEALLLSLFTALKGQCTDFRPEVRNTSVRALLTAILTHGARLTAHGWQVCFRDIVLPLLPSLTNAALSSSTDECDGAVLGVENGQSVHMLVHHSRNSQMKQWEETLAIFINEIARLLRTHMKVLFANVRKFFLDDVYGKLLEFTKMLILLQSNEVSLAAICALHVILSTAAWEDKNVGHIYWRMGVEVLTDAAQRDEPPLPVALSVKSRVEVMNSLGSLLRGRVARHIVDDTDVDLILQGMDSIVKTCGRESDSNPYVPSTPPSELLAYPHRSFIENIVKVELCGENFGEVRVM